jgi:hypothetical protein
MKAGVLGVVDGRFTAVDSFTETVTVGDRDLERCLAIDRVFSLPTGDMGFEGRAAAERAVTRETASIEGDDIAVDETTETVTEFVSFCGVPGEFVVVENGGGTFAFDLVGQDTGTDIARATLDLDGFYDAHDPTAVWKTGFFGGGEAATNGVFHGDDLRETHDLDGLLADARLNQLGLGYRRDGDDVKMWASRSGYVQVYRPSEYDTGDYLAYLASEVVPHVE